MNIFFRTKNTDIPEHTKMMMVHRMNGLRKFFNAEAKSYIDIERTHQSHHGHDLYYV